MPDGLYFVLDIQHYFEYVKKNHETMTDKSTVKIYINRITFKTKLGYYLELWRQRKLYYLKALEKKITKDKWKWWKCVLFRDYWSNFNLF